MKIAHEAPLSLMKYVQQVTDYDYALASLFEGVDGYLEYFTAAKKDGRMILLDNGVFEEGVAMGANTYATWIEELQPDEYVVPDVLEDAEKTQANFREWCLNYNHLPGKMIGVVQGKTLAEFVDCYKFMSEFADKIAISFDYSFYEKELFPFEKVNKWEKYVAGRQGIFIYLYMLGILNMQKPHHFLGAALPNEFQDYVGSVFKSCIESVDTSNPVVYAITQGRYPKHLGVVDTKNTTKMKDLISTPYSDKLLIDTIANITQFRIQNIL